MIPTDEQNAAARAWLERWVPQYTTGQWAALAELIAEAQSRAERREERGRS